MNYKEKYLKYNTNQLGGSTNNFIIIGNIRGDDLEFIPKLKKYLKSLNNHVVEYKFKFKNKRYKLNDLTFKSVSK